MIAAFLRQNKKAGIGDWIDADPAQDQNTAAKADGNGAPIRAASVVRAVKQSRIMLSGASDRFRTVSAPAFYLSFQITGIPAAIVSGECPIDPINAMYR